MSRHIDYGPARKQATAIVQLYRRATVRWLDFAYGRALRQHARNQSRIRRLAKRRARALVAFYTSRGIL